MIGILAGMGPKSTGPFVDQVVSSFQSLTGAKYDIDFPPMMIYSLPTPFYVDRPIDHKLMEKTICEGLQKLEACGASFIAMPSNSAHLYFSALQQCIRIPLLNIVDETVCRIPNSAQHITIVGTQHTLASGIYSQALARVQRTCILHPAWQKIVDEMILSIKSSAPLAVAIRLWEDLSQQFRLAKIDTILLVCTDLNVVLRAILRTFTKCEKCQGGALQFEPGEAGAGAPKKRSVFLGQAVAAKLKKFSDAGGSQIQWLPDAGRFTLCEHSQYITPSFQIIDSSACLAEAIVKTWEEYR